MNIIYDVEKFITLIPGDVLTKLEAPVPLMSIGSADAYEVVIVAGQPELETIEGLGYLRNIYSIGSVKDGIAYDIKGQRICAGDWKDVLNNATIEI